MHPWSAPQTGTWGYVMSPMRGEEDVAADELTIREQ